MMMVTLITKEVMIIDYIVMMIMMEMVMVILVIMKNMIMVIPMIMVMIVVKVLMVIIIGKNSLPQHEVSQRSFKLLKTSCGYLKKYNQLTRRNRTCCSKQLLGEHGT